MFKSRNKLIELSVNYRNEVQKFLYNLDQYMFLANFSQFMFANYYFMNLRYKLNCDA